MHPYPYWRSYEESAAKPGRGYRIRVIRRVWIRRSSLSSVTTIRATYVPLLRPGTSKSSSSLAVRSVRSFEASQTRGFRRVRRAHDTPTVLSPPICASALVGVVAGNPVPNEPGFENDASTGDGGDHLRLEVVPEPLRVVLGHEQSEDG